MPKSGPGRRLKPSAPKPVTADDVHKLAEHLAKEHIVTCKTVPLDAFWTVVVTHGDVVAVATNHPNRADMLVDLSKILRAGSH